MANLGYRSGAIANQLQLIAHLSRWLSAEGLSPDDLTVSVLDKFLTIRRAQGYRLWLSRRALAPFVDHLRDRGFLVAEPVNTPTAAEELLARYRNYLLKTRGLANVTARGYVDMVRPFVEGWLVDGQLDWSAIRSADVTAFVLSARHRFSIGSMKLLITALRSLLGYVYVEGLIPKPIASMVPSVAGSKLAGMPRGLEADDVQRLLAACDKRTRTGRRDVAILMLLARLGLRACEVRMLRLDDVDWRNGQLSVRGKGGRLECLPLPQDVGEALAAYLRHARPATAQGRIVFVRVRAPHRPLTSSAITSVVQAAASRAKLSAVTAHRLRHTLATQMVCSGVALPEIGQVLRHRCLLTTAIYAKVDRDSLRSIARQWPGGAS